MIGLPCYNLSLLPTVIRGGRWQQGGNKVAIATGVAGGKDGSAGHCHNSMLYIQSLQSSLDRADLQLYRFPLSHTVSPFTSPPCFQLVPLRRRRLRRCREPTRCVRAMAERLCHVTVRSSEWRKTMILLSNVYYTMRKNTRQETIRKSGQGPDYAKYSSV